MDPWLVDVPLYVRFHKLFELTDNPLKSVADMFGLGGGRKEVLKSGGGDCLRERMIC